MEERVDVLVVGAGISGLSCAAALHSSGCEVRVLEARPTIGGRLRSEVVPGGGVVDLGATWFWPGEHRVAAMVERLGLAIHDQHLAGDALYHDPAGSQRIAGNPLDVPSARFSDGAQSLADAVAASMPAGVVSLSTAVESVSYVGAEGLRVAGPFGSIAAGHVVIAVPPALAVSSIAFDPPLPERTAGLAAATPVWMGAIAKVVMVFDEPFWRQRGLAGAAISHFGPMREVHDMSGPAGSPAALFGFVHLGAHGEPDRSTIRAQLRELFGADAPEPRSILVQNWRDEAATSPPGVERLTAYQLFGHERFRTPTMGRRLHWATTETATESPGHIEGALQAAERAAAAILANP